MSTFDKHVVMITGASGGIGKEAALLFGREGARLALSDINEAALADITEALKLEGIEVFAQRCDVTDSTDVQAFVTATVEHFGQLDAAINNAGIDPDHHRLADMPEADFDRVMDINVKGVFLCMKHQLPHLQERGGSIVNVSSVAGVIAAPMMSAYGASKHAVIGLTKAAAWEYGRHKIRINAVCPFITRTPMLDQTLALFPAEQREQKLREMSAHAALKRPAEPREVAQVMLIACDPRNSYMTGHELMVDGGYTAI